MFHFSLQLIVETSFVLIINQIVMLYWQQWAHTVPYTIRRAVCSILHD